MLTALRLGPVPILLLRRVQAPRPKWGRNRLVELAYFACLPHSSSHYLVPLVFVPLPVPVVFVAPVFVTLAFVVLVVALALVVLVFVLLALAFVAVGFVVVVALVFVAAVLTGRVAVGAGAAAGGGPCSNSYNMGRAATEVTGAGGPQVSDTFVSMMIGHWGVQGPDLAG